MTTLYDNAINPTGDKPGMVLAGLCVNGGL